MIDFDSDNNGSTITKSGIGCPVWSFSGGFSNTGVLSVGFETTAGTVPRIHAFYTLAMATANYTNVFNYTSGTNANATITARAYVSDTTYGYTIASDGRVKTEV